MEDFILTSERSTGDLLGRRSWRGTGSSSDACAHENPFNTLSGAETPWNFAPRFALAWTKAPRHMSACLLVWADDAGDLTGGWLCRLDRLLGRQSRIQRIEIFQAGSGIEQDYGVIGLKNPFDEKLCDMRLGRLRLRGPRRCLRSSPNGGWHREFRSSVALTAQPWLFFNMSRMR